MKFAAIAIALGFALYWLNIGEQRQCEAEVTAERQAEGLDTSRADLRRLCRPERRQ